MNYYDILGIDKSASDSDIKKAYRKQAKIHHPDRNGDEEKFKQNFVNYKVNSIFFIATPSNTCNFVYFFF